MCKVPPAKGLRLLSGFHWKISVIVSPICLYAKNPPEMAGFILRVVVHKIKLEALDAGSWEALAWINLAEAVGGSAAVRGEGRVQVGA